MANFDIKDIKGVIPAALTFFDENENVDERRTREMTEFMINAGVHGFYLTGSTGLAYTMTGEERNRVVDIVCDQVRGRVPVIVHVGDIGTKKSIALAEHAQKAGADAISSVPPFYWDFGGDAIYNYYKDISESVDIPMIVYNVVCAGLMSRDVISHVASLPNVKGLKYTATTHDEMGSLKREFGKDFMVYSGCDQMAFSGLISGADGIIGSFYNVTPELYLKIYKCALEGNAKEGMYLQNIGAEYINETIKIGDVPEIHTLMRWRGLDAGYSRRPFIAAEDEALENLKNAFRRIKKEFNTAELDIFGI